LLENTFTTLEVVVYTLNILWDISLGHGRTSALVFAPPRLPLAPQTPLYKNCCYYSHHRRAHEWQTLSNTKHSIIRQHRDQDRRRNGYN